MLGRSDNVLAETVGREVAVATGNEHSFEGTTKAVTGTLQQAGLDVTGVTLRDVSGLSVENRIPARTLDRVISEAADLLYHLLVVLQSRGVELSEVEAVLAKRTGQSGLAEKAARVHDRRPSEL